MKIFIFLPGKDLRFHRKLKISRNTSRFGEVWCIATMKSLLSDDCIVLFRCYIYDVLLKRLKSDFIPNLPVELLREMVSIGTRNQGIGMFLCVAITRRKHQEHRSYRLFYFHFFLQTLL